MIKFIYSEKAKIFHKIFDLSLILLKAELPSEGIFFALNFHPWEFLLIKKLEIEKTETTFIISALKVVY